MLDSLHSIVIKVGSALITDDATGSIKRTWLETLAADIAALRRQGKQVIVVTSGAVALGRKALGIKEKNLKLEEKQAAAACGQPLLMEAWASSLQAHQLQVAQLLVTIGDTENRKRYLNARGTLDALLERGIIPIINENDTVATAEIRFGDNDRLAARVAQMAGADGLVLLSDIDGLYTANPKLDKQAMFIPQVTAITPEIEAMGGHSSSVYGSGGMITKLAAAKIALAAGCHMVICSGKIDHPLAALYNPSPSGRGEGEGHRATWFIATDSPRSARKHWIAGSIAPTGIMIVDDGAAAALKNGKSLLPAGVKKLEGNFERGDAVLIKELGGRMIGKGLSAYSAEDAARIIGRKSGEIEAILGFKGRDVLIHRDDLVVE